MRVCKNSQFDVHTYILCLKLYHWQKQSKYNNVNVKHDFKINTVWSLVAMREANDAYHLNAPFYIYLVFKSSTFCYNKFKIAFVFTITSF